MDNAQKSEGQMFANLQIQTPINPWTTLIGFIVYLLCNGSEK